MLSWQMVHGDIMRAIDGAYHFGADGDGGTEVALRPVDRARRAAARLRQAPRRGAHPQHGPRAEGPRRSRDPYAAGIDVGGTKCLGVVVDDDGSVVREPTVAPTPHGADAADRHGRELARRSPTRRGPYDRSASGVPGLVTRDGVLRAVAEPVGVAELRRSRGRLERAARPRRARSTTTPPARRSPSGSSAPAAASTTSIMVTLGTGIGGGIVADGRLLRGANGFAGEFGHMVVDPDGPPCPCGRRGCWERYASGSGLDAGPRRRGARRPARASRCRTRRRRSTRSAASTCGGGRCRAIADALAVIDDFARWVAARAGQPDQPARPGDVRPRRRAGRPTRTLFLPPIARWFGRAAVRPRPAPATRCSASPSSASGPVPSAPRCYGRPATSPTSAPPRRRRRGSSAARLVDLAPRRRRGRRGRRSTSLAGLERLVHLEEVLDLVDAAAA